MIPDHRHTQRRSRVRRPRRFRAWAVSLAAGIAVMLVLLIVQLTRQVSATGDVQARIDEAAALMEKGNYAPAYCIWIDLAQDGDPQAQYSLGWMFHNGYGVAIDDEQAVKWWEAAAAQGHAEAQFDLGMLFSQGSTVGKDMARAVSWYRQAAKQGHEEAALILLALAGEGEEPAREAVEDLALARQLGTDVTVSVPRASVREAPSTQSRRLIILDKGTRLIELGQSGKWRKVWVARLARIGWMHEGLIE